MDADPLADDIALAHALADIADGISRDAFVLGSEVGHEVKRDGTPVSATDLAVERALLKELARHRPQDAVVGEEIGAHGDALRQWTLDGIDGTRNFVAGDPLWSTLIALVEGGRPLLGVKSSPAQGRRWWAARGSGAWCGEYGADVATRLSVAGNRRGRRITACLDLAWEGHPTRPLVDRLAEHVDTVSMTTHPGFMVAAGEIDLAVQVAGGSWDFAAVMVAVWEAGGRCIDLAGKDVTLPEPPVVYVGQVDSGDLQRIMST